MGKLEERLTALEDLTQTQQDVIQQTKDANEQLYQGMACPNPRIPFRLRADYEHQMTGRGTIYRAPTYN